MSDFENLRGKPAVAFIWLASGPSSRRGDQIVRDDYRQGNELSKMVKDAVHLHDHGRRGKTHKKLANKFVAAGIGERVISTRLMTPPSFESITGSGRGIFGRKRVNPIRITVPGQPVALGEFDGTGNEEPAHVVGYDLLGRASVLEGVCVDKIGRGRHTLTVATLMTRDEALDLTVRLTQEPRSVRDYAQFVLHELVGVSRDETPRIDYAILGEHLTHVQFAGSVDEPPHGGTVLPF